MKQEESNQEKPEQTGGVAGLPLDEIHPNPYNPWDVKPDDEEMNVLKAYLTVRQMIRNKNLRH